MISGKVKVWHSCLSLSANLRRDGAGWARLRIAFGYGGLAGEVLAWAAEHPHTSNAGGKISGKERNQTAVANR